MRFGLQPVVVGFRQSDEFSFGLQPAVREMESWKDP